MTAGSSRIAYLTGGQFMEQFKGSISQDGLIVAEDVEVHFQIVQVGKLMECSGSIITGLGWQTFKPNTKYLLTAEDGRSGYIFFSGVVPFGDGTPKRIGMSFYEGFE
jgi:hypothetical protein